VYFEVDKPKIEKKDFRAVSTDILAEENSPTSTSQTIRKIYELLESHTGHDFSDYKINTINRRIENQMQRHHINTIEDYIQLLRNDSQFINKLFEDLLIGVTSFFRDNMAFEALQTALTLKLSAHPANEDTFRVWIPGCSTGEEAYTLAILILECIANLKLKLRVQIFATDIDNNALDVGRAATYHKSEVSNLTEERLNNFFISANDHYKLKKEVRELITFGFQNIILDPPFTKLAETYSSISTPTYKKNYLEFSITV
jgi:two-component system CheB/CheR fusion protein